MKKPITILVRSIVAGALAVFVQNAQSITPVIGTGNLYQNSTTYQSVNFNNGNNEAGNEVVLAGASSSDLITSFSFQFDFVNSSGGTTGTPAGGEMADVRFYQNNGPDFGATTYAEPSTVLFDSGKFSLGGFTQGNTFNFYQTDLNGGVVVPKDFTWTVSFSGLPVTENAGLALYSPATVGANFNDAWINDTWSLQQTYSGLPLDFGAVFNGSAVPDSSCLSISVMAVLAGFGWVKRFQRQK